MAGASARAAKDKQPTSGIFSCCVTGQECHHEFNPWSNAETEIQGLSTAALEALQEHFAAQSTEYFAQVYTVAKKEIASRKTNSRSARSNASTGPKQTTEVVFDVNDFGPPTALLDDQQTASDNFSGHSESDQRDNIAKMSLAWVSETRENARLRRTDGRRPAPVKHRNVDEVAAVIDVEAESSICFEDVEGLEIEMELYFTFRQATRGTYSHAITAVLT